MRINFPPFLLTAVFFQSAITVEAENEYPWCAPSSQRKSAFGSGFPRRKFFSKAAAVISGGLLIPKEVVNASEKSSYSDLKGLLSSFSTYKVNPDASVALTPTLELVDSSSFMKEASLAKAATSSKHGGVLWLGEHHNSVADHTIQADLIKSIYDERKKYEKKSIKTLPMAIGLEQIQIKYQDVLDDFVAGKISETEMLEGVDWEKRWSWPYDGYRPIFDLARKSNIPLIALNVNSEDLALVEQSGLNGLSKDRLRTYIKDPIGFGAFLKSPAFKTYASYVIEPSYDLHKEIGLLKNTMSGIKLDHDMSYQTFFSGRILWDESMAGNAYAWTRNNPGGLMVGLIGADHIKFSKGVAGRYNHLVGDDSKENLSVLLNPTLIDSRPPGSVSGYKNSDSSLFFNDITLQIRYLKEDIDFSSGDDFTKNDYTGGVLPIADYIIISKPSVS